MPDGLIGGALIPCLRRLEAREFRDHDTLDGIALQNLMTAVVDEDLNLVTCEGCPDLVPINFQLRLIECLLACEYQVSTHGVVLLKLFYLLPRFAKMISPVSQPASSEARNTATRAMCSGWPKRPSGVLAITCFLNSGLMTRAACVTYASLPRGLRALTRIFLGPNSFESTRVKPSTALFDAT